ncbi:diguanylate cyclase domain-containing protein [Halovibrio salipaludis]|nr:diguanylate cyclase [Halovibrio salipaludis]
MITYDYFKQREILAQEMSILTRVIASRSAAALSFNDEPRAKENVSSLMLRRSVTAGCIYDGSGNVFVKASGGSGASDPCPESPRPLGEHFNDGYLDVAKPVELNDQQIGTVLVRTDLSDLNTRLGGQLLANITIMVVSLLTALLLTLRLQRAIYQPIVQLGEVAHHITHEGNYSFRASTSNEDELGETVTAFNTMLNRIEQDKKTLTNLAYFDPLTELPNRRLFSEHLDSALKQAQRGNHRVGVMLIDLDRFKEVNDTLGHDIGDQYLQDCAQRLTAAMPRSGKAYRLAGDEFTVIIRELRDREEAEEVAERIFEAFQPSFSWSGGQRPILASIGVALSQPGDDSSNLLKKADLAVYRAKGAGRNNYQITAGGDAH